MTHHPDMTGWADRDVIRYGIRHDLREAGCTCTPIVSFADIEGIDNPACTIYVTHALDCPHADGIGYE
jgi:hypothetical protein